jgi:hypothetical protein
VRVVRARFAGGLSATPMFDAPLLIGTGAAPVIEASSSLALVAFERDGKVYAARSTDGGASFTSAIRIDRGGAGDTSHAPSIAIDAARREVFVAYHGTRGRADDDIWLVRSTDLAATWSVSDVRVDDDTSSRPQRWPSIGLDPRAGILSASWEDHREDVTIHAARSLDRGVSFTDSERLGVGFGADQVQPRVAFDPARVGHAIFIDTSYGSLPVFSRFNRFSRFDPAIVLGARVNTRAASDPAIFVDANGEVYAAWVERASRVYFTRSE